MVPIVSVPFAAFEKAIFSVKTHRANRFGSFSQVMRNPFCVLFTRVRCSMAHFVCYLRESGYCVPGPNQAHEASGCGFMGPNQAHEASGCCVPGPNQAHEASGCFVWGRTKHTKPPGIVSHAFK